MKIERERNLMVILIICFSTFLQAEWAKLIEQQLGHSSASLVGSSSSLSMPLA